MAGFKPKFWKPGTGHQSTTADRLTESEESSPSVIYNPHVALSIENQRQKLPIFKNRNHILYLLEKYQTVVIVGETGCGKSTQVPQYLLEAGWAQRGKRIGVTQPRRVAVITLAQRVAMERGAIFGKEVGYAVRFDDQWHPGTTKIKFMTEGILIREMMADPLLRQYEVILVDEVHERTLDTDVLLGLLRKVLKKRPELRLLVASATVDALQMQKFFNLNESKCSATDTSAIISVQGRMFPVDVFYVEEPVEDYLKAAVDTALKIHKAESPGDILIFLTGQEEVETAVSMLIDYAHQVKEQGGSAKMLVRALYGTLPAAEQMKVFEPTASKWTRKIVVATNIAETSVTIPGIVHVIDCGFVKMRFFNSYTVTDTLAVVPVSQASAEQRSGRAGRIRSGKAYRLYTEKDFEELRPHNVPEMQRSNMAFTVLQLKALGIDNVLRFHFLSPPPARCVVGALELLFALGALDDAGNLTTPLGAQMAEFPLPPMLSKMLLVSGEFGCSQEVVAICAMLQVQNVFMSPPGRNNQARKTKRLFSVEEGDLITLLNVYNGYIKANKSRQWCDRYYLNAKALQRATEVNKQLNKLLRKFYVPLVTSEGDVDMVCRCIVAGLFANAAYLHHSGTYRTVRGDHPLNIHPASVLYTEKQPQWVIFYEVMHTPQELMRDITVIDPKWLYELAPHYYRYGTDRELRGP